MLGGIVTRADVLFVAGCVIVLTLMVWSTKPRPPTYRTRKGERHE